MVNTASKSFTVMTQRVIVDACLSMSFAPLLAILAACGPVAQVESPTAPAVATVATAPVQADAPTATSAPTASAAPTVAPTAPPTATVAPSASPTTVAAPAPQAFYPCDKSFCSAPVSGGPAQPIFASAPPPSAMQSYAFSGDGAQLVYALDKPGAEGSATLYLLGANDAKPRPLFAVSGVESGNGGIEGYGALGFADNGASLVFEDQAQVFVAALDGTGRRPVMERRDYGASSTHTYYLAPDGSRVMVVGSGAPYFFEVADVASGAVLSYTLGFDRKPVAFGTSGGEVVVEQSDPPLDQVEGNPATKTYLTLGYELLSLPPAPSGDATLPPGKQAYRDDGSASRIAISNVAGGKLLLRDEDIGQGSPAMPFSLLDLAAGIRTPVTLPGYVLPEGRRVWLLAK